MHLREETAVRNLHQSIKSYKTLGKEKKFEEKDLV